MPPRARRNRSVHKAGCSQGMGPASSSALDGIAKDVKKTFLQGRRLVFARGQGPRLRDRPRKQGLPLVQYEQMGAEIIDQRE